MVLSNAIVELLFNCNVLLLVQTVLAVMPVVLNVPPFITTGDVQVAEVDEGFSLKSPAEIVVVPV